MRDTVTIAYRGAKFELGRGPTFYGIWAVGTSRSQPLQWWPDTPEGWSAAWSRFTDIETPDTIVPVGRLTAPAGQGAVPAGEGAFGAGQAGFARGHAGVPAGLRAVGASAGGFTAAALLAVGVLLGVIGLFPGYLAGVSLARQPAELIPHVIYLAAWTASAVLIALGGTRLRLGALLGAGLSLVTFGLFFADAGTAMAGGLHLADAGLVLGIAGWLACAAGSVIAVLLPTPGGPGLGANRGPLGRPRGPQLGAAVLLVLAGLGAAIAFAPSWDSFTLRTGAGQSQSLTAGNAFANPGPVIAGDVAVMVALAAVVIAAALWRPARHGAVLVAGATIPMVAQAISAMVQASEPATPAQFGFTPAQADRLGLTISSGLTPAFWVYCAFLLALVVSCAWMLLAPREVTGLPTGPRADVPPDDDSSSAAQPGPDDDVWHATAEPDDGAWRVPPADAFDMAGTQPPVPAADHTEEEAAAPGPGTPHDA